MLAVFVVLALLTEAQGWELLGLPWWSWLLIGAPAFLLTVDLVLSVRGRGLVRSRSAALVLLGLLVVGNFTALTVLVHGLITERASDLSGGELLFTAFAIYTANVIVFGLMFWELEAGGPVARVRSGARASVDFRFPQDDPGNPVAGWRPQVWDYLYVALTNSIAFSPTDTMPLTVRAKALMALGSAISAATILLVAARAVDVLGS
jgi:hypothetical protein